MMYRLSLKSRLSWVLIAAVLLALVIGLAQSPQTHAYTAWAPNTAYAVGALVSYGGHDYKCIQAHTSQVGWEPPNVPALWQDLGVSSGATAVPTATKVPPTATIGTGPTATRTNTSVGPT